MEDHASEGLDGGDGEEAVLVMTQGEIFPEDALEEDRRMAEGVVMSVSDMSAIGSLNCDGTPPQELVGQEPKEATDESLNLDHSRALKKKRATCVDLATKGLQKEAAVLVMTVPCSLMSHAI